MRKSLSLLTAAVAVMALATAAHAETLKVGMITTLSGGGAALGIDVRDGFLLAVNQAGADIEVIVDDDQRKPDIAVQLADKLGPERQGRRADRHHLVEPRHRGRARRGAAKASSTSRPTRGRRCSPANAATRTTSTSRGRTTIWPRPQAATPMTPATANSFLLAPQLSRRTRHAHRLQALL